MTYRLYHKRRGSGFEFQGRAGETLGAKKLVYQASDGLWYLADADSLTMLPVIGITMESIRSGTGGGILSYGYIGSALWGWTVGSPVYASETAGELTQTQPTSGKIQAIAVAIKQTMILFDPTLKFESLDFNANENNWDDLRVGATSTKIPTLNAADFAQVGTTTLYLPEFEDAKDDELYFETQMSHRYSAGTDLYLHVHWIDPSGDNGQCNWKIYYQLKNVNDDFVMNNKDDTGTDLYDDGQNVAGRHLITPTHTISGTGLKGSFCIFGRIVREHSAGGDTFAGSAFLLSLDLHYKSDKPGTISQIP